MNEWTNEQMNKQINEWMNEIRNECTYVIFSGQPITQTFADFAADLTYPHA